MARAGFGHGLKISAQGLDKRLAKAESAAFLRGVLEPTGDLASGVGGGATAGLAAGPLRGGACAGQHPVAAACGVGRAMAGAGRQRLRRGVEGGCGAGTEKRAAAGRAAGRPGQPAGGGTRAGGAAPATWATSRWPGCANKGSAANTRPAACSRAQPPSWRTGDASIGGAGLAGWRGRGWRSLTCR